MGGGGKVSVSGQVRWGVLMRVRGRREEEEEGGVCS